MTSQNDFSEIMDFIRLVGTAYLRNVHTHKNCLFSALNSWDMGYWSSNCFILKSLIYCLFLKLGTDPKQERLVWDCVKLQTSLSSLPLMLAIWNFVHVLTAAVYITWWGLKVRMEMFAEWWRHTLELYCQDNPTNRFFTPQMTSIVPMCDVNGLAKDYCWFPSNRINVFFCKI